MNPQIKKRLIRTAILSVIALIIGMGIAWVQIQMKSATVLKQGEVATDVLPIAGLKVGGPFTLQDHNGKKVTEKSLEGRYNLIYFGFTYCPAICPTELQKVTRVLKGFEKNAPELAEKIHPVFITIDPERDTVEVMKSYISLFHPRLIGLTGTVPQVDHVKKLYRVFAKKSFEEGNSDYTMDHSSYIYLIGPDGGLIAMYRTKDTADYIYEDMKAKINPPE